MNNAAFGAGHSTGTEIIPLGDGALTVKLGEAIHPAVHHKVRQLADYLERNPFPWMVEYVPSFASVTIYYDIMQLQPDNSETGREEDAYPFKLAAARLRDVLGGLENNELPPPRVIEIPVCYGGEWGPDLAAVAEYHGLTPEEVIGIHTSADYLVYMLGFAPGFAYLGGMPERIATPRRQTPRLLIPAGTVGIAGDQTGVYPLDTPGGWQLIGKTPVKLFIPGQMPPTLLQAGDTVRFYPISRRQFEAWEEENR
ncbi:5-oxoprolinase subunit PxpB [Paenibacillus macerans]|uniref:5-oxoprolinase subunit PxpB n=1 Tax=Paenibacillus macerans TaxID=44252 RepID=UPI002E1C1275|nr:5-oxoprolinase subunit PxpB [Paenibacillus macerans]MED4955525.1 5-oxoprolinase subunit PxpB [Paenibacillus macerans]